MSTSAPLLLVHVRNRDNALGRALVDQSGMRLRFSPQLGQCDAVLPATALGIAVVDVRAELGQDAGGLQRVVDRLSAAGRAHRRLLVVCSVTALSAPTVVGLQRALGQQHNALVTRLADEHGCADQPRTDWQPPPGPVVVPVVGGTRAIAQFVRTVASTPVVDSQHIEDKAVASWTTDDRARAALTSLGSVSEFEAQLLLECGGSLGAVLAAADDAEHLQHVSPLGVEAAERVARALNSDSTVME